MNPRPLLPDGVPLNDTAAWADEGRLHSMLARLRAEAPVCWVDAEPFRPYWAVATQAAARPVLLDHQTFLNGPRLALAPKAVEEAAERAYGGKHNRIRTVHDMDEPEHREYRNLTQRWFLGAGVTGYQPRLEQAVARQLQRMAELGGECDFATEVAHGLPLEVILSILGLPLEDAPFILRITQQLLAASDPDVARSEAGGADVVDDFYSYFLRVIEDRRARPTDDLASVIANARIGGSPLREVEAISYFLQIAVAGHETTAAALAGGLRAFTLYPEQAARAVAQAEILKEGAEEIVRWVTPLRHICRTAVRDTEVGGVKVAAGESLAILYPSMNRDEAVYEAPHELRLDRRPERHLGFGTGVHTCLGRQLALAEIRTFFRQLLPRLERVELAGEPEFFRSNFVGGYKHLPVRYTLRAA